MKATALFVVMASVALLTFVACGDDDGGAAITTPTKAPGGPNEGGQSPVFWRTADNFASVVAGQPYTVLFRITSGYAEDTLNVVASCESCPAGEPELSFEGSNSPPFPAGSDLPGSYYPMNIVLPVAGEWTLTVQAGQDEVSIPVSVSAARGQ